LSAGSFLRLIGTSFSRLFVWGGRRCNRGIAHGAAASL
jgi:hypothetical protein